MGEEIDPECMDIINEILGDDDDNLIVNNFSQKNQKNEVPTCQQPKPSISKSNNIRGLNAANHNRKCVQICLGGTDLTPGYMNEAFEPHFCSNLFCLSCDHPVIRFNDRRWDKSTNYLFLRNNYPDTVQSNLYVAYGWCAYCCQCTFCEDKEIRKLPPFSSNWICRGH